VAERTSWLAVEAGWDVVDGSGVTVGEVTRVVGDANADIFDGLRFETEAGDELYVVAERVADVREGCVLLDADVAQLERSPADEEPRGAEVRRDRDAEL
jgi:hypothetical protein